MTKAKKEALICYFCKQTLKNIDRKEIAILQFCNLLSYKQELYKWFLQNQHCPKCLAVQKKERIKILQWGQGENNMLQKASKTTLLIRKNTFQRDMKSN